MSTRLSEDRAAAEREPLISDPSDPARRRKVETLRHKLRTYEAILALKAGYLPSTEQLLEWVRYAMRYSGVLDSRNRRLSSPGRQFVRDVRAWMEAVADAAEQKNGDDKIQDFIFHTSRAQIAARIPSIGGAPGIASASDIHNLYSRLRLLFSLLYSSPEFRKLLHDFSLIARDIFADAASQAANYASQAAEKAQKAAQQARPSEDELAHLDEPAESSLPTKEEGETTAAKFESGAGHKGGKIPSKAELKKQASEKARLYAEETKRRGYKATSDIEEYLKHKFPKQRRDAVVNRLKKLVADIQSNPDFQETAEFIASLFSEYISHIKASLIHEGKKIKKESKVTYDEHFTLALQKGKEIIQSFASGKSLEPLRDALADVIRDVENDPDLSEFWSDVTAYLKHMITDPTFATSDEADAEAHELYDRSKMLLETKRDRYRPDVEKFFDEVHSFVTAVQNDKANRRVVEASKKVWNDVIVMDRSGSYKIRTRIARDLIDVLLPKLVEEIKYIPLPRIEYQDKDYDLILENIVLESDHFLPTRVLFEAHTRAEYLSAPSLPTSTHISGYTRLHLSSLSLSLRDTSFLIRKKTGILPFSDRGFLDLDLTLTIDILLDTTSTDDYFSDDTAPESFFNVRHVAVKVDKFKYKYNAYHSWAAVLCAPVVRGVMRRLISRVVEEKIKEGFEAVDRELLGLSERVRVATIASQGGGSLEAWIRAVLSRPSSPPWGRRGGGGAGVEISGGRGGVRVEGGARGRGEGFIVTIGAEEELFPGEHGPGAVLAKAGLAEERVEEGAEGEWRNKVFDIRA